MLLIDSESDPACGHRQRHGREFMNNASLNRERPVIPAQTGIQAGNTVAVNSLDSRLRGNDACSAGCVFRFIAARPITITMAVMALLIGALSMDVPSLQLTPAAIEHGQWWTLFTGHLLHVSVEHLLLDALGLLVVGCVFEPMFGRRWLAITLIAAMTIGLSAFLIYPNLHEFRGLSAIDHALLAAGAVGLAWRRDWAPALIILGVLVAKCSTELLSGDSTAGQFVNEAAFGAPVPWMHVIGALSGGMAAFAMLLIPHRSEVSA